MERAITLLEALTGYQLVIDHLDGRRLIVKSRPGEIVKPRNLLSSAEADWERFEHTDAFPGEDAGKMRTEDLEVCKTACRQKGYSGFTYWEDTAYFRRHPRDELLKGRRHTKGSTLFVCPDPDQSARLRTQRAVRGAGMPCYGNPMVRGNLFILLRVDFPKELSPEDMALLRSVLPCDSPSGVTDVASETFPELDLVDLDLVESARQHHIATGGVGFSSFSAQAFDEAPPAGSPGPPPPCSLM